MFSQDTISIFTKKHIRKSILGFITFLFISTKVKSSKRGKCHALS